MAETDTKSSDSHDSVEPGASPLVKWILVALFVYASISVLSQARSFFVPIVLAFLLSMVFAPIRRVFDRRRVPPALSSLVIVSVLLVSFLFAIAALAVPATGWIENAPRIEQRIEQQLSDIAGPFSAIFEANEKLQSMTRSDTPDVQTVEIEGESAATQAALLAPNAIAQFVFTMVLLLFLLASGDMFYEKLVHVMPSFRDKRRAAQIAHDIERKLSRYLLTITTINAGLGVAVGLTMWAFGMPYPAVFGVIAFLFNFIPYLGALGGVAIAGMIALITFDWVGWALIVPGVYFALTTLEGQIITPYFVGRSLRLNTVIVFITVTFWAWLWSAVGMIVALPLLVALKTLCEHIEALHNLGDFLSERHAELDNVRQTPPEH
ncbi:AI-2E family transporter [Salinisphaera sp.]|uniref:AI-2E family transporter n=1 Tax=Salinisphaera sp. TaxID=1914330 RepID=UPI000C41C1C7|nr:AI-2E family transporter [Salinisphaera sp.]MBS62919.1 AI-2E family transporter [Salinisphaera sp.]